MDVEILEDAQAVAKRGAEIIASAARDAISARGRFIVALSGGRTPWVTFRFLALEALSWEHTYIFQVDERVVPADHADRNLTQLRKSLMGVRLRDEQIHPMPVDSTDLNAACNNYVAALQARAGTPPILDLVHLGLGSDGHTASLFPADPVLDVVDSDVALAGPYQGRRRMTLTYPAINRARRILWLVTGAEKSNALATLRAGDVGIPAGRVRRDNAQLLADQAAAN